MHAWRVFSCGLSLFVFVLGSGVSAQAEIYKWVDETGKMHFTQDLGQVPVRQRAAAKAGANTPSRRDAIQYVAPPAARLPARASSGAGFEEPTIYKVHRIRVQKAGSTMLVKVRINDQLDVPFYIDTGASDVVIPRWVAKDLGLQVEGRDVRTNLYGTANGTIESAVVQFDSVALGSAKVEDVVGSVSDSMKVGLLGLSFFNHFTYNIDAARGILTLTENRLKEEGLIRGGRSEGQWRSQFVHLRARIDRAETLREEVPFSHARKRKEVEAKIAAIEHQLEILDEEADDARVPYGWRD